MPQLPSGTVTLLFTDVEGSTKLLHELGADAYERALQEHRRILRRAFVAHGGVEVDTQGDAFFVAFPTAPGAIEAAAEALEGLAAGPIRVRIGIHTGRPHLGEEGYVGEDVHRAARIAAAGHGGQVLVSHDTRALVDGELTDLGEHRLKDFAEVLPIYQVGAERFPPLKTISNTNLPRPASSFIGRQQEVREVTTLLQGTARLVTLSGPGGSGKTRLAIETAAELVPAFKAGVFWVGLATLRDPALVSETIGQTVGAKDGLAAHIGERELLLLLDNLEHVVDAAPELASLLEACPNLKLLVTSRELLRIRGEVEYAVPPLAEREAADLFGARSRLEPDETIAELCRRLDHLPLAVELAAARTKALSPAQILARLSKRLDLLKGGRDADPRQQTLRATIEWSYELLDDVEKRLFARLAVFGGGCTLEAAEDVAEADLDVLQSLVDKSLIRHTDERFLMLETIREYAVERLEERAEAAYLRVAHTRHFLELVETAEPELHGPTQLEWLGLLETEHDNVRAALRWTLEERRSKEQAALGVRLAGALGRFWYMRTHTHEGSEWLERALVASSREEQLARAKVLYALGILADQRGQRERATAALEESVALRRRGDDLSGLAAALHSLGIVARNQGDVARARSLFYESLALRREVGDVAGVSASTCVLAVLSADDDDPHEACRLFEESLALDRELGDQAGVATNLVNLGSVTLGVGDLERARLLLGESLRAFQALGDREGIAVVFEEIASLAAKSSRPAGAARLIGAADSLRAGVGVPLRAADRSAQELKLTSARDLLGDQEFEVALAEGQELPVEDALATALDEVDGAEGCPWHGS